MPTMMKIKRQIWTVVCLGGALAAGAQGQQGIVRTLERPGKPSVGLDGVTINVLEYSNAIVSKKGGKFSFTLKDRRQGDFYTISRIQKKGYSLVDKQMKGRRYAYSYTVPLEIVMVSDQQLENDKKRIEDKAYDKAKKSYDQKLASLQQQLNAKTISEQEYRTKYEQLSNDYNNYVQLIDQMAERYALTDYQGLSELNREILECVENAELERADSLINSKGDFDKREQELKQKQELRQKSDEFSRQLQQDIDIEKGDLIQDYYNKYAINAAAYRNDSAAYYLERLVKLVPTDVFWLKYTAGFIMSRVSDYPRAEHYYLQALEQAKLQYGEQSEEVGSIAVQLGLLYDNELDYDKAIEWHQKAIDILEPIVGTDNDDVSMAYTLIGRAHLYKEEVEPALEYTLKGLEIRQRMDSNDPQISQSYNNLGVIYLQMDSLDKAMEFHKKALQIREQAYGPEDGSTALSYLNIGDLHIYNNEFVEAMEWFNKALAIYEKKFGPVNPYTASCYGRIASAYYYQNNYTQAIEWYKKRADSYERLYGAEHSSTLNCYNYVAAAQEKAGQYDQALETYQWILSVLEKNEDTPQETIDGFKKHIEELKGMIP